MAENKGFAKVWTIGAHVSNPVVRELLARKCAETTGQSCAFTPCAPGRACVLVGGCVAERFDMTSPEPAHALEAEGLRRDAPAHVGTEPARWRRGAA